ncbi:MAG: TfoX/Sxy family protein [Pseudomonadota bacterium]
MALAEADIAFARDLFADLGAVTTRKMFGGICLYQDGTVFAFMSSDARLYLKVSGEMMDELNAAGAEQFDNMPYYSLPEPALDDPDEACTLALRGLAVL